MSTFAPGMADTEKIKTAYLTFDLAQAAGTYDLGTVAGGDIFILMIALYNSIAGGGLTSVAITTNDTTPTAILATAFPLAGLTGGLNLALFNAPFVLPSEKKIQGIIVGAGSAGMINLAVRYQPLTNGAMLS